MKILFFLFFVIAGATAQNAAFFVEFDSSLSVPAVTTNTNGTLTLTSGVSAHNVVYNSYTIYRFEPVTIQNIPKLENVYYVECNAIGLMTQLLTSFPTTFIMGEVTFVPTPLYIPNDYTLLATNYGSDFESGYLDAIDAPAAWDITEGSPDVLVGISDTGIRPTHEEFANKNMVLVNNPNTQGWHGHGVAGLTAAETNNGVGVSSIGHKSGLVIGQMGISGVDAIIANGAKVVNMSWGSRSNTGGSSIYSTAFNAFNSQGKVLVAAAGNGPSSGGAISPQTVENYASRYYYPASEKHVISVSTVGDKNIPYSTVDSFDNWLNIHKLKTPPGTVYNGTQVPINETFVTHQHNDSVDIVVPAYRVPVVGLWEDNVYWGMNQNNWSGTSFSAPIVTGTIGLMFSVNYCLKPNEVESILKLTAVDIELHPENLAFYGRLGAGALNAFKAVEMANAMKQPFGIVNVKDRRLYREWFYTLKTAPYEINLEDNTITGASKVAFYARSSMNLVNQDYSPVSGYVDLRIDENLISSCEDEPTNRQVSFYTDEKITKNSTYTFTASPNPVKTDVAIRTNYLNPFNIELFDIFGKSVYKATGSEGIHIIKMEKFMSGVYIARLSSASFSEVIRLIKE